MEWFYTVIGFGLLAFLFFVISEVFKRKNRFGRGMLFGFLELLPAVISSSAWAWALKVSGKADWFVFGIFRYTLMGLICYAMFAAGIWCIVANVRGIGKQRVVTSFAEKS